MGEGLMLTFQRMRLDQFDLVFRAFLDWLHLQPEHRQKDWWWVEHQWQAYYNGQQAAAIYGSIR
jgi:hypothetical protein